MKYIFTVLLTFILNIDLSNDIAPGSTVYGKDHNEQYILLSKIQEYNYREVWVGYKYPSTKKYEAVHIHVYYKNQEEYYTSNGVASWPGQPGPDYSTYPKPPKSYWTRSSLKDLNSNKFVGICENHKALGEVLNALETAKVQKCLTMEVCPGCIEHIPGKTLTAEPIINIFEGIEGLSLRDTCFEGLTESQESFNLNCFKIIPEIFRGFKEAQRLFTVSRTMHGNISLDTLYYQNIGRQRLWFTNIDDDWGKMNDDQRKFKDIADFIQVIFKVITNDDSYTLLNWSVMRKEYETRLSEYTLEKNTAMNKYAAVLGSADDGIFECFKFEANAKMHLKDCKYPNDFKNTMVPPDM